MLRRGGDQVINVKSKRGQILRIVRERYLRNDIKCGIGGCLACLDAKTRLSPSADHYLVPDAETCLDYLEIFETVQMTGIIVAQTIIDVVQDQRQSANRRKTVRRLRELVGDGRRFSSLFSNENFQDTYLDPSTLPNLKHRNNMAIAKLASWFASHIAQHRPNSSSVIFLTSKQEVKAYAISLGLLSMTLQEYMQKFWKHDSSALALFDSVHQVVEDRLNNILGVNDANRPSLNESQGLRSSTLRTINWTDFVPHLADEVLEAGVKSGQFQRGKLQVSRYHPNEASVKVGERTFIIPTYKLQNRAIHGDVAILFEVPSEEVKCHCPEMKDHAGPFGRVVGVDTTHWRKYVCTLQEESSPPKEGWVMAVPWDKKIPKIRIRTRQYSDIINHRIVVSIDKWDVDSNFPQGHYVKSLGPIGDHETEMQVLLHEGEVDTAPFAPALLAELPEHSPPSKPWKALLDDPKLGPRRDLTDWRIYSIDPPGCQDIDDALSCRTIPGSKNLQIGVHIADVSAFVLPGSLIDMEAQARSTSVYLADRRIDMLPTLLSERLCSLRCNEDRYAVSVVWEITPDGNIIDTWYGRTLIKTAYEMCYSDAQDILDNKPEAKRKFSDFDQLRAELLGLQHVFHILRDRRYSKGALELESVEVGFKLDEKKKPQAVLTKESKEIHALVAEFMIFANCQVAEFIAKHNPEASLLRCHPLPRDQNFKDLIEMAASRGCQIDASSNFALAQSLNRAATLGDRMFTFMLRSLTTLAMSEAQYISSGSFAGSEFYHYGLAAEFYTHFTSPIRRYADVLVHRELLAILAHQRKLKAAETTSGYLKTQPPKPTNNVAGSASSSSYAKAAASTSLTSPISLLNEKPENLQTNLEVQTIAEHLNLKNRQAKMVQRHSRELYQVLFFTHYHDTQAIETAVISSFKHNGLMLYLPQYGFNCLLSLNDSAGSDRTSFSASSLPTLNTQGSVSLERYEVIDNKTKAVLKTSAGSHTLNLFDCISIRMEVRPNRSHMSSIQPVVVNFVTKPFEVQEATSSSSGPATSKTSAKGILGAVKEGEAKRKQLSFKLSYMPPSLLEAASRAPNDLYSCTDQWSYGLEQNPSLLMDPARALASFVLSVRNLHITLPSSPAGSDASFKKPVVVFQRKFGPSGRKMFQEKEYKAALDAQFDDEYYEEEEEVAPHPASASIPGLSYGPSSSFGSTNIPKQEQERRLAQAAAKAEKEFKTAQAQVSKSKYASRHY